MDGLDREGKWADLTECSEGPNGGDTRWAVPCDIAKGWRKGFGYLNNVRRL